MAKISVCAECFYTDLPVEKRIEKVAEAGYKYIEFWHPEGTFDGKEIDFKQPKDAARLKRCAQDAGVQFNDFAFGAWDGSIGGNPTDSADHAQWLEQCQRMLDFAQEIECPKGIVLSGLTRPDLTVEQMNANLLDAYGQAAVLAEKAGIVLNIEPLNSLVDHAGYYLDTTEVAVDIIRQVNSPHLRLLYDIYHMQIMQGNVIDFIEKHIDLIGHFHAAGVPGRAELFGTELNYPAILKVIDSLGYDGCVGLEYFPKLGDEESLKQTYTYLHS